MARSVDCKDCGEELTRLEIRFFNDRCEECETDWNNRVEAWRFGAKDAELDRMFAAASTHTEH